MQSQNVEYDWWQNKTNDTLTSINLSLFYDFIKDKQLKPSPTKIAVLDTDVDVSHKDMKSFIWINDKEIESDLLDNDNNGYVNDIHGWNFIAKKDDGVSLDYTLIEETRILRAFGKEELDKLKQKGKITYSYEDVQKSYDEIKASVEKKMKPYADAEEGYTRVMDTLKKAFNKDEISLADLEAFKSKDSVIIAFIDYAKQLYSQGYVYKEFMDYLTLKRKSLDVCLNLDYDNRELIGDDQTNISDVRYGSPFVNKNSSSIAHGTEVAGILVKEFEHLTKEHHKFLSIMPLVITGIGDPTDKDTALALIYAVDNGAKVINLSQTKTFSMHETMVKKALKYAAKRDVLIIKSAGNEKLDLDVNIRYPNDLDSKGVEIVDNMVVVGATSQKVGKKLKAKSSNYGKNYVDIFAPSAKIKTLIPADGYITDDGGTSYAAPIVAGIATMIRSYYPKLTAKQVKQILMDSGTKYDVEVEITLEDKTKKMVPFSELSKSGKVVNAYNALLMAEGLSKN